jgi:hypothetical protein
MRCPPRTRNAKPANSIPEVRLLVEISTGRSRALRERNGPVCTSGVEPPWKPCCRIAGWRIIPIVG